MREAAGRSGLKPKAWVAGALYAAIEALYAVLGYADLSTTTIYTIAIGAEAREFITREWG